MISTKSSEKIYYFTLLLISASIPTQLITYKIGLIILVLNWLVSLKSNLKIEKLKNNKYAILLVVFYFLYGISFFWSTNHQFGATDLILKLPILIFPIVLCTSPEIKKQQLSNVFLLFGYASVCVNMYSLIVSGINYLESKNLTSFYYYNLGPHINSTYQSMVTLISLVIFLFYCFKNKTVKKGYFYLLIFLQFTMLILFSSRMQIGILMIIIISYFCISYYKTKKIRKELAYLGGGFLLILFFYIPSSPAQFKYQKTIETITKIIAKEDVLDTRIMIWTQGVKVIQENIMFGTGCGDIKDAIKEKYKQSILDKRSVKEHINNIIISLQRNPKTMKVLKQKAKHNEISINKQLKREARRIAIRKNEFYKEALEKGLNFHNQYLQVFATIGFFGFLVFIYLLMDPFLFAIKKSDYFILSIVFIIAASLFSESMLEREAGVSCFGFLYSMIIISLIGDSDKHVLAVDLK